MTKPFNPFVFLVKKITQSQAGKLKGWFALQQAQAHRLQSRTSCVRVMMFERGLGFIQRVNWRETL